MEVQGASANFLALLLSECQQNSKPRVGQGLPGGRWNRNCCGRFSAPGPESAAGRVVSTHRSLLL